MRTSALIFMLVAWTFVLGLTGWAYRRLLATPKREEPPSPGSSP